MSFTRNFEIRRYAGTLVRDGSLKTAAGSALVLGTLVVPGVGGNAGKVVATSAATDNLSKGVGVVWYEHIQYQGVDPNLVLYMDRDTAPANALVQVLWGKGVRVQYTNTPLVTLADGRTRAARTLVGSASGAAIGKYLEPAAGGLLAVSSTAAGAAAGANDVMRIVECDVTVTGNERIVAEML